MEPTIRLSSGNLVGELAEGLEERRGIATPLEEQHRLADHPVRPESGPPTKKGTRKNPWVQIHM